MVIGTGGTTAAGVIDPLLEIAHFCRDAGSMVSRRCRMGRAAVVSPSLRHHLAGIEAADSITCDAHKWLSVPMGCGMFFCRHPETVAQAFRTDVSYMPGKEGRAVSSIHSPPSTQWSRRFIGLKLFMALAEHGEAGTRK